MSRRRWRCVASALVLFVAATNVLPAVADAPANPFFRRTWERTDKPVADGAVARTWMWGPEAISPELTEQYVEGEKGARQVQYFDKSRMEITTDPAIAPSEEWYVSNGLLVLELVTGRMQVGDNTFEDRAPAWVNVAGDDSDHLGPTYATFAALLDAAPYTESAVITATVNRYGLAGNEPDLAEYQVTAGHRSGISGADHRVASVFWEFMSAAGTVWQDDGFAYASLFSNPFYATGYPITEAYWANVLVSGERVDVLVQCFERRCLTYTPDNPEGWKVEAGNVGRHYFEWRYADWPGAPPSAGPLLYESNLSDFAPFTNVAGTGAWMGERYVITDHDDPGTLGSQLLVHTTDADHSDPFGDHIVGLEVRITSGGPDVFACLVTRYERDASGSRRYALCIDGYDTVSAVWETFDEADQLVEYQELLEFTATDALVSSSVWNRLEIVSAGDRFWFVVNGDVVGTARHTGQASGWAGFYLVNDMAGAASAEFRNLVVSALGE